MHHLVGLAEISKLLGVSRARADQVVRQTGFPRPDSVITAGRIWRRDDVEAWVLRARPGSPTLPGSSTVETHDAGSQLRLYGMLEHLLRDQTRSSTPQARERSEVIVTKSDALYALVALAGAIDEPAQRGALTGDEAAHAGALVMVVREYIEALPSAGALEDLLSDDLRDVVASIRDEYGSD